MAPVKQIVLQCIVDLCAANRAASRQVIALEAGLRLSVVDDHVKTLRNDRVLRNVVNGVVAPVDIQEDRAVYALRQRRKDVGAGDSQRRE